MGRSSRRRHGLQAGIVGSSARSPGLDGDRADDLFINSVVVVRTHQTQGNPSTVAFFNPHRLLLDSATLLWLSLSPFFSHILYIHTSFTFGEGTQSQRLVIDSGWMAADAMQCNATQTVVAGRTKNETSRW